MQIIRGTTPTIIINVKDDIDFSQITSTWIFISQRGKVRVDKTIRDITVNPLERRIKLPLSQEDTLNLKEGDAIIQVRILMSDGTALSSLEEEIEVLPTGKEGEIEPEQFTPEEWSKGPEPTIERIKLNLIPVGTMPTCHASQFDKKREIEIEIYNGAQPYFLSDELLELYIKKPDGNLISMDIPYEVGSNSVIFETTEQACAVAGKCLCELRVVKGEKDLGSLNFYLQVETAPDENGITSQSEIKNLARQVHDIVVEELADNGAEDTGYDNTESGLDATNVQDAIDEVNAKIENIPSVDAYTKQESDEKYATKSELSNKADVSAIPTKTSQLQNDSGFAEIDDSEALSNKTWSGEKTYNETYDVLPTKTASGAIANFKTDISKPVEFEAEFEADVGGVSNISVTHCGKNLCPKVNFNTTDFTMDDNGVYTQNNPASASWAWAYSRAVAHATLPAGIYTITAFAKVSTDRQNSEMRIFSSDNVELTAVSLQNVNKAHVKVALNTETTIGVAIKIYDGAFYFQIENGSTSSNHEPFDSVTKTISLGDTFYNGGTLSQDRSGHRTITAGGQILNLPDGEPLVARIGTNNIYANTGDMSVNYKESVDEDIGKALADVQRLPWWSRFQSDFLRIAYSDIGLDKINTATHWLFASDMGFNVLKGDVEITSDGELIMNHDPGFTFDSNGRIISYNGSNNTPIKEMTYAECRSKVYASMPQRFGGYCPVADVDDFIKICKDKGKICFLTIRTTNTEAVVAKALEKIKYYGMESRTILNATHYSIIDTIRENHEADEIAVNYVAPIGTAITKAQVDECLVWGNAFLTIWSANSTTVIDDSAEAIAYAKQKGVPLLSAVCTDMTFWNYIIERGIIGCQISKPIFDVEPKTQGFTVKITNGVVTFGNLYSANRFTGNVELSGTKIYVTNICVNNSFLADVIDGIQPIKMNLLKPVIRCYNNSGVAVECVWNSTYNRLALILNDTNDNTYTVLVTV